MWENLHFTCFCAAGEPVYTSPEKQGIPPGSVTTNNGKTHEDFE